MLPLIIKQRIVELLNSVEQYTLDEITTILNDEFNEWIIDIDHVNSYIEHLFHNKAESQQAHNEQKPMRQWVEALINKGYTKDMINEVMQINSITDINIRYSLIQNFINEYGFTPDGIQPLE